MKKTAAAILSLLLMTGTVAGMADGAYTPGTYRQSAKGMGGDVVVDVTFDADAMTAIDVVSQNETAGLGDVALTSVAQAMLDAQSRGWVAARMAKTDLAVLRLAVGEMLYMDNVPNGVAINEAVNLAKKYGEAQSPKFINAVLSKINRSIEEEV